jgi:hypothetical protein
MIPSYIEYDHSEYRTPKLSSAMRTERDNDEKIILEMVNLILTSYSFKGMGSLRWRQLARNGQMRLLPFLLLFKTHKRYQESRQFMNVIQAAHAARLTFIPKSKLTGLSPKLRKELFTDHRTLLEKLGLWNPRPEGPKEPQDTTVKPPKPPLGGRAAPVIPPKDTGSSYAQVAAPDNYNLYIYGGKESKLDLSEEDFTVLRKSIIKHNCYLSMDETFEQNKIDFIKLLWKPSHGILACASEKSQQWFKEKLLDQEYTGGIVCRGWAAGERDLAHVHFQVPHEFEMSAFDVITILKNKNPQFEPVHMEVYDVKPARDGNKEVFIKADDCIRAPLSVNHKVKMPWGICTIIPGKPNINKQFNTASSEKTSRSEEELMEEDVTIVEEDSAPPKAPVQPPANSNPTTKPTPAFEAALAKAKEISASLAIPKYPGTTPSSSGHSPPLPRSTNPSPSPKKGC